MGMNWLHHEHDECTTNRAIPKGFLAPSSSMLFNTNRTVKGSMGCWAPEEHYLFTKSYNPKEDRVLGIHFTVGPIMSIARDSFRRTLY